MSDKHPSTRVTGWSGAWKGWNITKIMAAGDNSADPLDLAANEDSAHPKAYALLGTAQGMLDRIRKESKEKSSQR